MGKCTDKSYVAQYNFCDVYIEIIYLGRRPYVMCTNVRLNPENCVHLSC